MAAPRPSIVPTSDPSFSFKKIAVPAFGPSILYGLSSGAILPVVALTARDLGASLATAGLIVGLIGIGSLLCNIPATIITSRYGERRAMVGASLLNIVALLLCLAAQHPIMLAVGVFLSGAASSVFMLARQSYMIDAVPAYMRARALSTLAGTMRIGAFAGPLCGAGLIYFAGLDGAYWIALLAMIGAALIAHHSPDFATKEQLGSHLSTAKPRIIDVAKSHYKTLITLGLGILLIGAVRSSRQVVLPLWSDHLGLTASTTSLIYGLVAAIDMSMFYPSGTLMDRRGRLWVAVPAGLIMGIALIGIPFSSGVVGFVLMAMMLGFGNGISSGIVMTLGADAAPTQGRTEFLGLWRLVADTGSSLGPIVLSAITAALSLATAVSVIGIFGLGSAAVFWRWLPRNTPLNAPTKTK
jgi:MFS family permease